MKRTTFMAAALLQMAPLSAAVPMALGMGIVMMPREARADATAEQRRVEAEALHEEGKKLANAGQYSEARKKFLQAYAKNPLPGPLFNAARMEHLLGEYGDALALYRTYLALPPSEKVTAEARKDAEQFARECESKVCQIEVKVTGPITVDGEPKAGRVIVTVGKPHAVLMEGPDGRKERQVTCAKAGETILVEYASTGGGAPPPPPPAPPPPKEEGGSGSWVLPGVLAGVGVVGLGVGIGLGAASSGADSDARALGSGVRCNVAAECPVVGDKVSSLNSTGTGSVVGYVAGGAFLGAAVVSALILKPWRTGRGASAQVVPGLGGMSLVGSF
jgi:hypothetical protein